MVKLKLTAKKDHPLKDALVRYGDRAGVEKSLVVQEMSSG